MSSKVTHYKDHIGSKAEKFYKATLFQGKHLMLGMNCLEPGQAQKVHTHTGAAKVYFVLEGTVTAIIGDGESVVGPETAVLAPADVPHGLRNDSDARAVCLVFMAPNPNAA